MWVWSVTTVLVGFCLTSCGAESFGYMQMCSDGQLEGFAIFDQVQADHSDQIVAIFKANRVWTVLRNDLIDAIQNQSMKMQLINSKNGYELNALFPNAPQGFKKVVSFYGHKQGDPFYNNLLILERGNLFRFRVNKASLAKLEGSMVSVHKTRFWQNEEVLYRPDLALYTMSGSKLLFVNEPNSHRAKLYSLNDKNLDFPASYTAVVKEPMPASVISAYKVPSRNNNTGLLLSLLWTGHICYGPNCARLSDFVDCDAAIKTFISGFTFWLQYQTNLTFRLLAVGLISVMLVNSVVAIVFVMDQVDKITLLT